MMRSTRPVEQALRFAISPSAQQYVCQSCRIQARRHLSTSRVQAAEEPFWKRMRDSIFGSKESNEAEKRRDVKQKERLEALAEQGGGEVEIKKGRRGREYKVAAIIDPSINKDYVEAIDATGLETIGSEQWIKEGKDRGEQYLGFMPKGRKELTDFQWKKLLHHIAVEALVLQGAGRNVDDLCNTRSQQSNNWRHTTPATFKIGSKGRVGVEFPETGADAAINSAILQISKAGQSQIEQTRRSDISEAISHTQPAGEIASTWTDVSLSDPTFKLAILKRVTQLTGKRLPDPAISACHSLADLYNAFKVKEKAKKLTNTPQLQRLRVDVPNITVYDKRETMIVKERKIGRWKVIEDELQARNLPITGSNWPKGKLTIR